MEQLMEILEGIRPDVDFENETALIDDEILESFDIVSLVSELIEAFDVEIGPAEMIPANFNSAQAILEMIERLKEE